jgi:dihydroxyacid dehydratase/phosphogluconate dehydratase
MLHLRRLALLNTEVLTVTGKLWTRTLIVGSQTRTRFRELLQQQDGVSADEVIFAPEQAKARGMRCTLVFPRGNLAPEGSVVKVAAIDPSVVGAEGVYHREGPARVFVHEKDAMTAIKQGRIKAGDVLVLTGIGPLGTGMEETYQVTGPEHLPFGKEVALDRCPVLGVLDRRMDGPSPRVAGGPDGKVLDGDTIHSH